jgi:hypothetical protein
MLDGLENGKITVEESKEISECVICCFDKVETPRELVAFLTDLGMRWPVYQSLSHQLRSLMPHEVYKEV